MKKLSKKQMEQMDNMIKNIWTQPTNNKQPRKTTKYKGKKYETQTVLIRLVKRKNSTGNFDNRIIPSSVMNYAVDSKNIIIDEKEGLALVEVRLTHQQNPTIPRHVRNYMVEQVELKDKESIDKEFKFKGMKYPDSKLNKPKESTIKEVVEEVVEEVIQPIKPPITETMVVEKPKVKTTVSPKPLAKSDKITIPIISFSIWRLAIKFTIEFKR
tara:strand:- start:269 stop:907 length:639 start_codon:yes stop_codon:yes gene_type:complete